MKTAIVFGTRPEIIKLSPVIRELGRREGEVRLIHTGQHNLDSLREDLDIRTPDFTLDLPPKSAGKFRGRLFTGLFNAGYWTFLIAKKVRRILKRERPDFLLYQGDTLAIASASVAGRFLLNRPVLGHIEAGLRTGDIFNPFPEEISRRIADCVSDLLFAPTAEAEENLKKSRSSRGRVYLTGNTVVDAVLQHLEMAEKKTISLPDRYGVVFIHRQENVHRKSNLTALYNVISELEEDIILIEHPTLIHSLERFGLLEKFENLDNLIFRPFFDYLSFLKVLKEARYIITDSGGLQEEVCTLKTPCLIWRKTTERPEAIESGAAVLLGDSPEKALDYIGQVRQKKGLYKKVEESENPFGDGKASKRIVNILEKIHKD